MMKSGLKKKKLQFVVDASEEHHVFVQPLKQILHGQKRGARCHEVVEDNHVRFVWDVICIKHRADSLLRATMSAVEVKRDAQFLGQSLSYQRRKVATHILRRRSRGG